MSNAAKRLERALGSDAFNSLEAYLRERDAAPTDFTFPGAEVRDESGNVTHIIDECGTPQPVKAHVIKRIMTDGISTKDGCS
jgi:hypothetical protein